MTREGLMHRFHEPNVIPKPSKWDAKWCVIGTQATISHATRTVAMPSSVVGSDNKSDDGVSERRARCLIKLTDIYRQQLCVRHVDEYEFSKKEFVPNSSRGILVVLLPRNQ